MLSLGDDEEEDEVLPEPITRVPQQYPLSIMLGLSRTTEEVGSNTTPVYDERRIYNANNMPEEVRRSFLEWATPRYPVGQLIDWPIGEYWGDCVPTKEVVDSYLMSTGVKCRDRVLICYDG